MYLPSRARWHHAWHPTWPKATRNHKIRKIFKNKSTQRRVYMSCIPKFEISFQVFVSGAGCQYTNWPGELAISCKRWHTRSLRLDLPKSHGKIKLFIMCLTNRRARSRWTWGVEIGAPSKITLLMRKSVELIRTFLSGLGICINERHHFILLP